MRVRVPEACPRCACSCCTGTDARWNACRSPPVPPGQWHRTPLDHGICHPGDWRCRQGRFRSRLPITSHGLHMAGAARRHDHQRRAAGHAACSTSTCYCCGACSSLLRFKCGFQQRYVRLLQTGAPARWMRVLWQIVSGTIHVYHACNADARAATTPSCGVFEQFCETPMVVKTARRVTLRRVVWRG